jgi:hypothetical protein
VVFAIDSLAGRAHLLPGLAGWVDLMNNQLQVAAHWQYGKASSTQGRELIEPPAESLERRGRKPSHGGRLERGFTSRNYSKFHAMAVSDAVEVAPHTCGEELHAPAMSESAWHVSEAIQVLQNLTKMLGPSGIGLARLTWELELDGGHSLLANDDEIHGVGDTRSTPLWLQGAWPHTSSNKLLNCGEPQDVLGEQLLQSGTPIPVEHSRNPVPDSIPGQLSGLIVHERSMRYLLGRRRVDCYLRFVPAALGSTKAHLDACRTKVP